jgi:hypothetical protein
VAVAENLWMFLSIKEENKRQPKEKVALYYQHSLLKQDKRERCGEN